MTKLKHFNPDSKTFKLFNALHAGDVVTASEATKRFGIKNISAEVSRIRYNGFPVYSETRKAANGVIVTEYRMGSASRRLVAAGYRALSLGI